jgi:hypothetical protein
MEWGEEAGAGKLPVEGRNELPSAMTEAASAGSWLRSGGLLPLKSRYIQHSTAVDSGHTTPDNDRRSNPRHRVPYAWR